MKLKTGIAFLGALVGIGGAAGLYFGLGVEWIALGVFAGVALLGYIIAAAAAAPANKITGFGEFMRGFLIGINTGLNGLVAFALFDYIAGLEAGIAVGIILGLFNFLCVFSPISQSGVYQGFIGWLAWLMPMSWLIVALGLVFLIVSWLLHLVTGGKVPYLRIEDMKIDWKTGTIFVKGGLVANLNYADTAFNMGNFSFVDYKSGAWHMEHEAGHTLNLTAFGSLFHLIGALDENVIPGRGARAFAERIADSNDSGSGGSNIPMWV